jgi:hypothetical protein
VKDGVEMDAIRGVLVARCMVERNWRGLGREFGTCICRCARLERGWVGESKCTGNDTAS